MINKISLATVLIVFATYPIFAQTVKIRGTISDAVRNKAIPFASVGLKDDSENHTTANDQGHYTLTIPVGKSHAIEFRSMGYKTINLLIPTIVEDEDIELNVRMDEELKMLDSVVVLANTVPRTVNMTLDIYNTKDRHFLLDASIESLITTLPGVSSNDELSSQYKVRGGNFDENIVYINGIEVYRPLLVRSAQQEGLSVINPTMVESVGFSAGGFNAEYGDIMSSVLDITYKKPAKFEGSIGGSLMDGSIYAGSYNGRFSQITSARYKTTKSLLKTTDMDGNYDPRFMDMQTFMTLDISPRWDISFLGNYSQNRFQFEPETRTTSFGTLSNLKNLKVYFDGWEKDKFETYQTALSINGKLGNNIKVGFMGSYFSSDEYERYDISGRYRLTELADTENVESQSNELLGIGTYHEHARNSLNMNVFDVTHTGQWTIDNHLVKWGLALKHQQYKDKIIEWEMRDSTGYSILHDVNSNQVDLYSSLRSKNNLSSNRFSAYLQDRYLMDTNAGLFTLIAGVRASYWDFNEEFLISPRASLYYIPSTNDDWTLRLSGGVYYQAPFYKEYQQTASDENGNDVIRLNNDIRSQRSYHIVLGGDYNFRTGVSQFKFTSELYYKGLSNIIPYTIDNVKVRYSGKNEGNGYITGVDFRLFGELVPRTTSWLSLSLMKTEQKINGQKTPLPTDQRYNISVYLQDYMPGYERFKLNLKGVFSDGIPFTAPHKTFNEGYFRTTAYKRVDLGLSWQVLGESYAIRNRSSFCSTFKNIWLGLDVFNLFDINNVNTHYWVTDVYDNQYAVPNYLTGRQANIRLLVDF